jgi:hypothetical protein
MGSVRQKSMPAKSGRPRVVKLVHCDLMRDLTHHPDEQRRTISRHTLKSFVKKEEIDA